MQGKVATCIYLSNLAESSRVHGVPHLATHQGAGRQDLGGWGLYGSHPWIRRRMRHYTMPKGMRAVDSVASHDLLTGKWTLCMGGCRVGSWNTGGKRANQ
jgi:hypothetical protein